MIFEHGVEDETAIHRIHVMARDDARREVRIYLSDASFPIGGEIELFDLHDVQAIAIDTVFVALGGAKETSATFVGPAAIARLSASHDDRIVVMRFQPFQIRTIDFEKMQFTVRRRMI